MARAPGRKVARLQLLRWKLLRIDPADRWQPDHYRVGAEHQRRLKEALEEAVRSRDSVLSVVAHDLRNPLNVISLAANALLQRLPEASDRRLVERITRSAQRADHMIADLLAISAIETGRFRE